MATLYVGADQTYTTIKAALEAAADGDTVIISAGDYSSEGEIQINKALTVKAAENADVIVDHIVLGASYNQPRVDSVTISGLTMKPTAFNGGDWNYTGVWQNNQNIGAVTVEDCVVDFTNAPTNKASVGFKFNRGVEGATTAYSVTGCTVIANGKTQNGITIGTQAAVENIEISGNTFTGGYTSSAVHMDMGHKTAGEYSIAVKNNNIENTIGRGIYFGGINNENAAIEISDNTIVANSSKCAVGFHSDSVKAGELNITGNNISGAQVGIDMTYVASPGEVDISGNTIAVTTVTTADGSPAPTGILGYTPAGENTVTVIENASNIIVSASVTGNIGDVFSYNGKNYIIGTNAFAAIKDALAAAGDNSNVFIAAGNYDEVVSLTAKGNKNNVTIAGETDAAGKSLVNWTGSLSLPKDGTTWNDINVKDINFINTTGSGSCVTLKECYRWTFENCSFSSEAHQGGWGWNPIVFPSGANGNNGHTIKNCTLTGGSISTRVGDDATLGYGLKVVGCTILNTNFNIQSGGEFDVIFEDNDITVKYDDVTATNREGKDNAFIVTKSDVTNANIVITGGTLSMVGNKVPTGEDKGWTAIYLGKNFAGTVAVDGVVIKNETANPFVSNFTNTATTVTAKIDLTDNTFVDAAGNVITDPAKIANELLNLKIGNVAVNYSNYKDANGNPSGEKGFFANENGKTTVFYTQNGTGTLIVDGAAVAVSTVYVNAAWAGKEFGEIIDGKIVGVSAFGSFVDALANVTADTDKIEIAGDITEDIPAETLLASLSKDLVIAGTGATAPVVTLNNGGYKYLIFGAADGAEDIDVKFENIQLVAPKTQVTFGDSNYADDDSIVYSPVKVVIDSASSVSAYVVAVDKYSTVDVLEGGKFFSTGEVMNVKGTLNAAGSEDFNTADDILTAADRQVVAHYMWNYGTVSLTDTYATVYSQLRLIGSEAVMTLDNARLDVGVTVAGDWLANPAANAVGWVKIAGGSEMVLTNNSVMKASGATGGYGLTVDADGAFKVVSGSNAEFGAGILNNGAIIVDNGSLTVGSKFVAFQTSQPSFDFVNNGAINVSGESTLNIGTLTGNAIQITADATLTDSKVAGTVKVGFDAENVADTTLTLAGDTSISTLYVGKEGRINQYAAKISGEDTEVTLGQLYNRTNSVVEVSDGATVNVDYWQSKGSVLIDAATVNHIGVNMYVYNNDSVDTAVIKLVNGAVLNSTANYAIFLGNTEAGPAKGNAQLILESGSTLNTRNLTLHAPGIVEEVAGAEATTSVSVADSTLNVTGTLVNNGTINVSGESAISAKVTGDGWICMDNAALDADTNIQGGKVRFTNGTSTLSGAVVNSNAFQVGWGAYEAADPRETVADVVVNVTNNSYIHSVDNDYYGWVGTGWFESDAEKAAAMTDARYTLNITNSIANFGYLHVSTDGILNVTGNAAEKESYAGVSYSYYGGRTMINGVATFDNVDALVQYTNVSCDNGTDVPGKLVIKNGANYVSWLDSSSNIESFKISKNGVVEVDNAFVDARHGTLIAADASLEVKNGGEFKGKIVTNNGTVDVDGAKLTVTEKLANTGAVNVSGESTLNIAALTGNAVQAADGATLKDSSVGGTVQMLGDLSLAGDNTITTIKAVNGGTLTLEDGKTLTLNSFSFGSSATAGAEYVITGGKITANYGFFQHGTYTLESDFETGYMYYSYGSDITVKGSFHSQGKGDGLDYVRGNLTVANGGESIHDKSLWVGQPASWGAMKASLTVKAGGKVQANSLQVYEGSSMTIEVGATVIANSFTNAGTLTVSGVAGMDNQKYLLVDVNSKTDFGNVVVDIDNYTLGIIDNDLYLVNYGTVLVNAAFANGAVPDGYVLGVNAFVSFDDFSRSADASQGVRTIKYTADKSGALEIGITSVSGRTDYQIGGYSRYVRAGNTRTETLKVEAGNEYTFVFTNEQADFELSYKATAANTAKDFNVAATGTGITIEANGSVAEAIGKQELSFTLDKVGDLNFTISIANEGKVEYTLLDAAGKTVLHGYSSKAIRRWADNLAQGKYTLVVESMDGKTANFNVSGEVDYKVTGPSGSDMVSDADDTIASAFEMASGTTAISNWVGNTDGIDYIDITDALKEGRNYLSIQVAGSAQATIWTLTDGKLVELISWNISDETDTRALRCTTGVDYFVSMKSDNDSNYTMQLS